MDFEVLVEEVHSVCGRIDGPIDRSLVKVGLVLRTNEEDLLPQLSIIIAESAIGFRL